jgi:diamine N-acetyltransferase
MINGERVRLRAPEKSDIPHFVAWLNDAEVTAGLTITLPLSQADEEIWFDEMLKRPPEEHPLTIEVQQADQWIPVGNCGLFGFDWRCRSAEVGIFIGEKSFWNRGYGTETMRLILRHGFNTLNLNRVALCVYENNPRAIRSYEKAGFKHEGRQRQGMYKDGKYIDVVLMSVLRSEWQE